MEKRFENNRMGVVAVFRHKEDGKIEEVTYLTGSLSEGFEQSQSDYLEETGYVLDSLVITNVRETYYRAKLKSGLAELRNTVEHYNKQLESLKGVVSNEVLAETEKMMHDYEETLMNKVGMRVSCLVNMFEVEVTDELALQCYDYRNRQIAMNN